MAHLKGNDRQAQLRLVMVIVLPDGSIHARAEAMVRGVVAEKPADDRYEGFPFRSLLFLPEIGKFYNHEIMTEEENTTYNHRKVALMELKSSLQSLPDV